MASRKYLVYQVTNRFDGKIYIGCHSTMSKDDRYMGSGVEIKEALKKYGRKSFVKEILFEFDTKEEMLAKEKELVTKEFCMREDTYNRIEGGGTYLTEGMTAVKDQQGNQMLVYSDDPRFLSGELIHITKGTVNVFDENGKNVRISKNDIRYLSGELKQVTIGKTPAKDELGNKYWVDCDDVRFRTGELIGLKKGIPSGIKPFEGKNHSEEFKKKIGEINSIKQSGSGNSQFGTCWIKKEDISKKIKKEEILTYLEQGWVKGR